MTKEEWMHMHRATAAFFDNEERNHAGDFDIDDDDEDDDGPASLAELRGQARLAEAQLRVLPASDSVMVEHWQRQLSQVYLVIMLRLARGSQAEKG